MKRHTVAEVMTADVVSVRETCGFKEIVDTLSAHSISAVPVIDAAHHVLGVVSEADLLPKVEFAGLEPHLELMVRRHTRLARTKACADIARDLMTAPAVTVSGSMSVAGAAKLMDEQRLKRLPVVDERGRLVGIVSRADLLRPFLRPDGDIRDEVLDEVILRTMCMDPEEIAVTVSGCIVALEGTVDRRSTVPVIIGLVRSVAGVVDVIDALTYRYDDMGAPAA